jgi:hypothetical protein
MPDAPWRCSECGTINEPVANSCRTCGRWPSLFDLQDSVLEETELGDRRAPAGAYVPDEPPVEPETFEPAPFETAPVETEPYEVEPADEAEAEDGGSRRRRAWTSLIVPIAFAIYILISIVFGDRG